MCCIKLSLCFLFLFLNRQNKKSLLIPWNTFKSGLGIKHTVMLVCYLFQSINKEHTWMVPSILLIFDTYTFYFLAILGKQYSILRKMFWQILQCCFFFSQRFELYSSLLWPSVSPSLWSTEEKWKGNMGCSILAATLSKSHTASWKGNSCHFMGFSKLC